MRHIYDAHCIVTLRPEIVDVSAPAFNELLAGDVAEFGRQQPDFAEHPVAVLEEALAQIRADEQTRAEYELNLLPLVYGSFKPHFDEAFASFESVARRFLGISI